MVAGALLALHAVLCWLARAPGIETGRDDAKYLLLGRALRHLSYRDGWHPAAPIQALYPPGYPAALALWGAVSERFDWLILLNVLASTVTLFLVWRTVRRLWSDSLGLAVLAALVLNPYLVGRAGYLMSEPLFTLLSVATVALLAEENPSPARLAGAGALAIGTALTRAAGAPILVAVTLLWLLQKRWKAAALFGAASLLTIGGWLLWTVRATDSASSETYVGQAVIGTVGTQQYHGLLGSLHRYYAIAASHVADYFATQFPLVLPMPTVSNTIVDNMIGATVATVGLVAGLVVFWRRWRAAALYLGAVVVLLLLWPWMQTRFLVPLVPLLVPAVLLGCYGIFEDRLSRWRLPVVTGLTLVLAVTGAVNTSRLVAQRSDCERGSWPPDSSCVVPDRASFLAASRYVAQHLPQDAVVATAKPEPLYYYSGRHAFVARAPLGSGDSTYVAALRRQGAGWFLLGSVHQSEPNVLRTRLTLGCRQLAVEATFPPRTVLFRLLDAPAADSTACRALETYRRANHSRDFSRDPE